MTYSPVPGPYYHKNKYSKIRLAAFGARNPVGSDEQCPGSGAQTLVNTLLARLTNGGELEISDGSVFINAPILVENSSIVISGAGKGSRTSDGTQGANFPGTRIRAQAAFTGGFMVSVDDVTNTRTVYGPTIQNLTIDANNVAGASCLEWRAREGLIHNVLLTSPGSSGYALKMHGRSSGDHGNNVVSDTWIRNGTGTSGPAGLYLADPFADCVFSNLHISNFTLGAGILLASGSGSRFANCNLYNNLYNVNFAGVTRFQFTNCSFNNAIQHSLYFDGVTGSNTRINFTGCEMRNNSTVTDNTYSNFYFLGNSAGVNRKIVWTGGRIEKGNEGSIQKYAIEVAGSSATNVTELIMGPMWLDDASEFGTGIHNLNASSEYRFLACGDFADADTFAHA